MEQKKKIGGIILDVVILFLLLIVIMLVAIKIKNPNNSQEVFGINLFTVISGSMEPKIEIGDIVVVKKTDNINKGDIIAFENDNIITVHRVNDIIEDNEEVLYQTKGDNNNTIDTELVSKDKICGVYIFKIPKLGRVVIFVQNNLIICAGLLVSFILLIGLVKFIRRSDYNAK